MKIHCWKTIPCDEFSWSCPVKWCSFCLFLINNSKDTLTYILEKFIKNFQLKIMYVNPRPSIWNLVSGIVHRKLAAAFFLYLPIFKLNLKVYHCYLNLGPAANQKWFKYTFQQCIVFHLFEINLKTNLAKWRTLEKK